MTQKEKAEAYDKAIEIIKGNLNALNEISETGANVVNIQSIRNCFYRAFPDLCESEDENIKSCIGMCLADADEQRFDDYNTTLKDCLDWVEKQGETYTKKDVDDAYLEGMAFAKDELEKQNKQIPKTCKDEQKPVDNDLEYASEKYACRFSSSKYGHDKVKDVFIAGAQWRKEHLWKPSDKQMEAIRIAAEVGTANDSWAMGILKDMYNDLNKLKEK